MGNRKARAHDDPSQGKPEPLPAPPKRTSCYVEEEEDGQREQDWQQENRTNAGEQATRD